MHLPKSRRNNYNNRSGVRTMKLNAQYIVNERGERTAVLLPLDEYRRILEAIEDQLDAADLDEAVAAETDFIPYEQARKQLVHPPAAWV